MESEKACFLIEDVDDDLPEPGYYESQIISARFRRSSNGNRMIQVIHCLDGVSPAHQTVADYFVINGSSSSGIAMGRRRLVQLYRTCGLEPKKGEEIYPKDLVEARLKVRVEHDEWEDQPRLRIVGYRPSERRDSDSPVPF